jgi:hypothetical protein
VVDRERDPEVQRGEERARPAAPAPPLQVGTRDWASAVGNQAVARAASSRATLAREEEEEAPEAEPGDELEEDGAAPAPEELTEELPE